MPKYVPSVRKETVTTREQQESREERLMREAAEPTGYDILLADKEKGLKAMRKLFKDEPNLTRKQLSARLGLSMRTVYRYMRIIREGKNIRTTVVDDLVAEKARRVAKMRRMMKDHPEYTRTQIAEKIGVSRKTLYSYLGEVL